ncbi:RidA family protein [Amycolatopsis alkalitolerans]|uniref:RidA family protein n=1 Tax=Amycolatopsis alkalitolerans TaxID=2547244 RepID=A0A5C4LW69_9PSEU|nr:RidA family protein [Amycolatopsis alkalitolerans]TNC23432.1 RidA family protein [Amycolatopsis alkalitolerans]
MKPAEPATVPPQGDYVPAIIHNGLAFSAGMTPRVGGRLAVRGVIGADLGEEEARRAAGMAASNALRAIAEAAGGLDAIERCLRMTVYLACVPGFTAHSRVADGASVALRAWLGDRGQAVRSAIGVRSLPSGAPVEVELTAAVRE